MAVGRRAADVPAALAARAPGCDRPIVPGEQMVQVGSGGGPTRTPAASWPGRRATRRKSRGPRCVESAVRPAALRVKTGDGAGSGTVDRRATPMAKRAAGARRTPVQQVTARRRVSSGASRASAPAARTGRQALLRPRASAEPAPRSAGSCRRRRPLGAHASAPTAGWRTMQCDAAGGSRRVIAMCARRMITELTSRLESTAQGHLGVERLQADFLNSQARGGPGHGEAGGQRREPQRAPRVADRARGAGTGSTRSSSRLPAYFRDTQRADLTKTDAVQVARCARCQGAQPHHLAAQDDGHFGAAARDDAGAEPQPGGHRRTSRPARSLTRWRSRP